jgi:hypothetical protein
VITEQAVLDVKPGSESDFGFRGSPEYAEWARLLHAFYNPFPTVEHFSCVETRVTGA